jgi:hypothetical protein
MIEVGDWSLEGTGGLTSRVEDGITQFMGEDRYVHVAVVTDDEDRSPEEFLRELTSDAPDGVTEQLPDGVRLLFRTSDDEIGEMPHQLYGYVVRRGSALLVACFYSTPELGEWAEHVVRSARSHVS